MMMAYDGNVNKHDLDANQSVAAANKRRRNASLSSASVNINDLTDDTLAAVADFLPKTSRALFAVALTAPAASWRGRGMEAQPSSASKAIILSVKPRSPYKTVFKGVWRVLNDQQRRYYGGRYGQDARGNLQRRIAEYYGGCWDILDFIDTETSLAANLSDDDIWATLMCINARKNLTRLNLTQSLTVTGCGLEPLRSSAVLEKIDIGLFRDSKWGEESLLEEKISEEAIFALLDGILGVEGNSFTRLQFPLKWCFHGASEMLETFLGRHDHAFLSYSSSCCYFGFANQGECISCIERDSDVTDLCAVCHDADFGVCSHCNHIVCTVRGNCENSWSCSECGMISCSNCRDRFEFDDSVDTVIQCEGDVSECEIYYCSKCRLSSCRGGFNHCQHCRHIVFDELVEENERLRREVEELRERAA